MRLKVSKSKTLPIGLDLGSSVVKLAQLTRRQDALELSAAVALELPVDIRDNADKRMAYLTDQFRNLLRQKVFVGRQCVMSLPAQFTCVQHVKTAKVGPKELDKALRWELEGKLPFPAADAIIQHVVVAEIFDKEPGLEVIVVAAPRWAIDAHLELAKQCKLDVVAMDVEPCAILECFARVFRRGDDAQRVTLFLDLGGATTQVVIGHGSRLVFARNLAVGGHDIDKTAAEGMGVSVAEFAVLRRQYAALPDGSTAGDGLYDALREAGQSMVVEITKCLRYYESVFPAKPVERALFLGGQALDRRLCQSIAQQLNLPARVGDPLTRIGRSSEGRIDFPAPRQQAQPAWAVAVGLGLGSEIPHAA